MPQANGANGVNEMEYIMQRARQGSRSLPFMTDTLGNSLNDRLLFAVPKSKTPSAQCLNMSDS